MRKQQHRIVKNMAIMGIGQVTTFGLSLGYVFLVSHYLGPTRFGELTLAKAIVVVISLGAQLGIRRGHGSEAARQHAVVEHRAADEKRDVFARDNFGGEP